MESAVCSLRSAFTREHTGRILALALEREYPGREGEVTRNVLLQQPSQEIAMTLIAGNRDLGHRCARKCFDPGFDFELAATDSESKLVAEVALPELGPLAQQPFIVAP